MTREEALALLDNRGFADLCRRHAIGLAVLFGSTAKGSSSKRSDIDLAMLIGSRLGAHNVQDDVNGRLRLMDDVMAYLQTSNVDLVILNHADSLLRFEIAKAGRPVYQATPAAFAEFCSLAIRQHEDSKVFYKAMDRYLARAAERGTNL